MDTLVGSHGVPTFQADFLFSVIVSQADTAGVPELLLAAIADVTWELW
jgi:hypothetical protein